MCTDADLSGPQCRSDTFFKATAHMASAAESGCADGLLINHINHKGGYPGFVQADSSGKLWWEDYAGNNVFSSLGEKQPTTAFAAALFAGRLYKHTSSYTVLAELGLRVAGILSQTPIAQG